MSCLLWSWAIWVMCCCAHVFDIAEHVVSRHSDVCWTVYSKDKILLVLCLYCCTHMTCWMREALNHIKCFPFLFHVWRCTKIHWEIILNVLSSIILKFNVKWTLHIHFSACWKCKWGLLHLNLSCHYVSSYQTKMKWHFAFPFRQIFSQACFCKVSYQMWRAEYNS